LKLLDDTEPSSVIPISDSTLGGLSGIDSRYMNKAALYARVSTDAQQKEGTITSQVVELKGQIEAAGHVKAGKEYQKLTEATERASEQIGVYIKSLK
jgi:hypothetical protein